MSCIYIERYIHVRLWYAAIQRDPNSEDVANLTSRYRGAHTGREPYGAQDVWDFAKSRGIGALVVTWAAY